MRFVPVKSVEQQSMLVVHRLREGFKEDRTACINRIRGLLLEFGIAIPKGVRPLELLLDDVLEDACNEMNFLARIALQLAQAQWRELDAHLAWCDERIAEHAKNNDAVKRAGELMGIGPIGASAHTRSDPISRWVLALKLRSGWQKAVVAMANKNARILWAVMTKGERFDWRHVSEKPKSPTPTPTPTPTPPTTPMAAQHAAAAT
jgi:transposase